MLDEGWNRSELLSYVCRLDGEGVRPSIHPSCVIGLSHGQSLRGAARTDDMAQLEYSR